MSYQRWSETSNLYLYLSELQDGSMAVVCCLCRFRDDKDDTYLRSVDSVLGHISAHESAGHLVGTAAEAVKADREHLGRELLRGAP